MSTFSNSCDALRSVKEIYHLQCAREEFGDEPVIGHLTHDFMQKDGLSFLEANQCALDYVKNINRTINNQFDFKDMRRKLRQSSAQEQEAAGQLAYASSRV